MPQSSNTTLMELAGRMQAGGIESIIQRYPDNLDFLIIPPVGIEQPPLLWTSQTSTLTGTTELCKKDAEKILSTYADPRTVVTPIEKKGRNSEKDIIVGRDNEADIRLKDSGISKKHAQIKRVNGKVFIKDLESTNGTFINRCRLMSESTYQVSPGQELRFAETRTAYLNLEHLLDLVKLVTER